VSEAFAAIEKLNKEAGLTIILVEQSAQHALEIADYAYLIHEGRVMAEGNPCPRWEARN
jgi:branched-chain amino acid transport system ATP-binding protein